MNQYFLKFDDKEQAESLLESLDENSSIHVVGEIYTQPIDEGDEPILVNGWHVNVLADSLPSELANFEVVGINTPMCVFAGY